MAKNIELKAHVKDVKAMERRIKRIAGPSFKILHQEDVFYNVPQGRLKLRIENNATSGQLIPYLREDMAGPKSSEYALLSVQNVEVTKKILSSILGVRGTVRKTRTLHIYQGDIRIHLDTVEGLGNFIEFEAVESKRRVKKDPIARIGILMQELGIDKADLVEGAYIDLIERMGKEHDPF